jgi:hypothetical protein
MTSKTHKLSIYLIKSEVLNYISALKTNFIDYTEYKLKESLEFDGLIIVGRTRTNPSDWRSLPRRQRTSRCAKQTNHHPKSPNQRQTQYHFKLLPQQGKPKHCCTNV